MVAIPIHEQNYSPQFFTILEIWAGCLQAFCSWITISLLLAQLPAPQRARGVAKGRNTMGRLSKCRGREWAVPSLIVRFFTSPHLRPEKYFYFPLKFSRLYCLFKQITRHSKNSSSWSCIIYDTYIIIWMYKSNILFHGFQKNCWMQLHVENRSMF